MNSKVTKEDTNTPTKKDDPKKRIRPEQSFGNQWWRTKTRCCQAVLQEIQTYQRTSETISDSAECYAGLSVCFESSAPWM